MRVPQVSERIKEAPAQALRGVFAGIGQLLLITDKIRHKTPADQDVPRARTPETAEAVPDAPVTSPAGTPGETVATTAPPAAAAPPADPEPADTQAVSSEPSTAEPVTASAVAAEPVTAVRRGRRTRRRPSRPGGKGPGTSTRPATCG